MAVVAFSATPPRLHNAAHKWIDQSSFLFILATILFTLCTAPLPSWEMRATGSGTLLPERYWFVPPRNVFFGGTPTAVHDLAHTSRAIGDWWDHVTFSARCDSVVKRSRPMLSRLFSRTNINKLPSHSTMSCSDCHGKRNERLTVRNICFDHVPPNPFSSYLLDICSVHTITWATTADSTTLAWMDPFNIGQKCWFTFSPFTCA